MTIIEYSFELEDELIAQSSSESVLDVIKINKREKALLKHIDMVASIIKENLKVIEISSCIFNLDKKTFTFSVALEVESDSKFGVDTALNSAIFKQCANDVTELAGEYCNASAANEIEKIREVQDKCDTVKLVQLINLLDLYKVNGNTRKLEQASRLKSKHETLKVDAAEAKFDYTRKQSTVKFKMEGRFISCDIRQQDERAIYNLFSQLNKAKIKDTDIFVVLNVYRDEVTNRIKKLEYISLI